MEEFVGSKLPTPKGGVLTVLSCNGLKSQEKRYEVRCDICNEDVEVYPENFSVRKCHLTAGAIPCGCAKNRRLDERQFTIMAHRSCAELGYLFKGFVGVFENNLTKCKLLCLKDNTYWESTTLNHLMQGHGCLECKKAYSSETNLVPQSVREVQITTLLEEGDHGMEWSWIGEFAGTMGRFNWVCSEGHPRVGYVASFLRGSRCRTCADIVSSFGLYKHKLEYEDNLYFILFSSEDETFVKVGRAFDCRVRMRAFNNIGYTTKLLGTVQGLHKDIFKKEKDYHAQFSFNSYLPKIPFGGSLTECFTTDIIPLLPL